MMDEHLSFLSIFGISNAEFRDQGEDVVVTRKEDVETRLFRSGKTIVFRSCDPEIWGHWEEDEEETFRRDH